MKYDKKDAVMTQGMAILSMLVLHLFCRTGDRVLGTPLIWLNDETPLVYVFGFFAEICVPIYSMCAGYARELMYEKGAGGYRDNLKRVLKLMINYWIVLCLFVVLGLFFDKSGNIPGSITEFLKSIVLLHSYNGAWWFLHSYVIMMLIPSGIIVFPVQKIKSSIGIIMCFAMQLALYLIGKFHILPDTGGGTPILITELRKLIGIMPYVWLGGFLCKEKAVEKVYEIKERYISGRKYKTASLVLFMLMITAFYLLHKAVLVGIVALVTFFLFNLWEKSAAAERIFMFLGKHSTNIWLTHMFFYAYVFEGLVTVVKYPILMLVFMLVLTVAASYVIIYINKIINNIGGKVYAKTNRKEN